MVKTKATATERVRNYFSQGKDKGQDNPTIAKRFNVGPSLVCRVRHEFDKQHGIVKKEKKQPSLNPVSPVRAAHVTMCVALPTMDHLLEIKIQNGQGRMKGTLIISGEGVRFRHANQKKPADRVLTYTNLDKIMQLGLL